MKSARNLRLQIRVCQGALLLLLGLSTVAAVATHQLLLDAGNQPTSDFDISGSHVVGTLNDGRLSGGVPRLDGSGNLAIDGSFTAGNNYLFANSSGFIAGTTGGLILNNEIDTDGAGNVTVAGNINASNFSGNGAGLYNLSTDVAGMAIFPASITVNGNLLADAEGNLYSSSGATLANGSGNIYVSNGLVASASGYPIADSSGNLYAGSNFLTDPFSNLFASSLSSNSTGYTVIDNDGNFYAGAHQITDQSGNLYAVTATVAPFDPASVPLPASGVTLFTSSVDGKLHALDAAGTDHALW